MAESEFPTVALAGKQYPVKPLVLRQTIAVVPLIMRLRSLDVTAVTEQELTDLTEIAYQAICPAQDPPLTRDAFLSLPVTLGELIAALVVVARQTGMLKDAAPGEATGAASPPDWDALISHIITVTGWEWDYCLDYLTMARVLALSRYWRNHPPTHLLAAAYLGVAPKTKAKSDLGELVGMFEGGVIR